MIQFGQQQGRASHLSSKSTKQSILTHTIEHSIPSHMKQGIREAQCRREDQRSLPCFPARREEQQLLQSAEGIEPRVEQQRRRETSSSRWSSGGGTCSGKQRMVRWLQPPARRQPLASRSHPAGRHPEGPPCAPATGHATRKIQAEREAPSRRPRTSCQGLPCDYSNRNNGWIWANGTRPTAGVHACLLWRLCPSTVLAHYGLHSSPTMQPCLGESVAHTGRDLGSGRRKGGAWSSIWCADRVVHLRPEGKERNLCRLLIEKN
jgi:hypothetical protein